MDLNRTRAKSNFSFRAIKDFVVLTIAVSPDRVPKNSSAKDGAKKYAVPPTCRFTSRNFMVKSLIEGVNKVKIELLDKSAMKEIA